MALRFSWIYQVEAWSSKLRWTAPQAEQIVGEEQEFNFRQLEFEMTYSSGDVF